MTTGEARAFKLYNDIPAELQPFYDHILSEASMRRIDYEQMTVSFKNHLRDNPQSFEDVAELLRALEQTVFSASLADIVSVLGTDRPKE